MDDIYVMLKQLYRVHCVEKIRLGFRFSTHLVCNMSYNRLLGCDITLSCQFVSQGLINYS